MLDYSNNKTGEAGFTLIELLIVMSILALIVGSVTLRVTTGLGGAQTGILAREIQSISKGVDTWIAETNAATTSGLSAGELVARGFFSGLCANPLTEDQRKKVNKPGEDIQGCGGSDKSNYAPIGPYDNGYRVLGVDNFDQSSAISSDAIHSYGTNDDNNAGNNRDWSPTTTPKAYAIVAIQLPSRGGSVFPLEAADEAANTLKANYRAVYYQPDDGTELAVVF